MIVTKLKDLLHQSADHPSLLKAVEFLQEAQGQELDDGRIEIDGKQVYALIQSYQGKTEIHQPRFEAHRRYIDVQYLVSGKEFFGGRHSIRWLRPTNIMMKKMLFTAM